MRPAKFEPAIPASERPQTQALDRATTGMGCIAEIHVVKEGAYGRRSSSERKVTSYRIVTTVRFLVRCAIPNVMKIRSQKKVKEQMVSVPRTDVLKSTLNKKDTKHFV